MHRRVHLSTMDDWLCFHREDSSSAAITLITISFHFTFLSTSWIHRKSRLILY